MALDVSASMDTHEDPAMGGNDKSGNATGGYRKEKIIKNDKFDEALEISASNDFAGESADDLGPKEKRRPGESIDTGGTHPLWPLRENQLSLFMMNALQQFLTLIQHHELERMKYPSCTPQGTRVKLQNTITVGHCPRDNRLTDR
jgi:hypothetical protein